MAVDPEKTVVLVHGLWVTADSWTEFRQRFEDAGYRVLVPTWGVLAGQNAAQLNNSPPSALGGLSIGAIVDGLAAYIDAQKLSAPPLLVGHSFGGLFVQKLLDRGIGWAGVAINPAPIGGIVPGPVTLGAALPVILRWAGWRRVYCLTRQRFAERYANAAPAAQQNAAYDSVVIPTSGKVFYQAAFWIGTWIKARRRTQPLLITAGDADRLVTPYLSRAAYRIQKRSNAQTDFRLFPGRSHFLISEPGWEEVADTAIGWAASLRAPAMRPVQPALTY
jgi:pimeloyl-ACP methyl ester carboxylesterase